MAEKLRVIALISGGKDSFFSLIHCLSNGHQIVALGNLYPAAPETPDQEENDLNSFMYQTVGHQVIPLYSEALGLPLYRQEIKGSAVVAGLTYAKPEASSAQNEDGDEDETESLIPLLKTIMKAHPEANALSTGAILSTYQRTRVESVALRLGLIPISYLWQYPFLPGHSDITLLQHMSAINLDARIIKVASGGLDESFLWENVASVRGMNRLDKAARRFGTGGGAVMGEGGEYETLVLDGPDEVFRGRIVVEDGDRVVVREGGGAAWLRIKRATLIMKDGPRKPFELPYPLLVEPQLLEPRFKKIYDNLRSEDRVVMAESAPVLEIISHNAVPWRSGTKQNEVNERSIHQDRAQCTFDLQSCLADGSLSSSQLTLKEEIMGMVKSIRKHLDSASLEPSDIVFALIMLRSMEDFGAINEVYGTLYPSPNPAARVTIACGDVLPRDGRVMINLTLHNTNSGSHIHGNDREALHVQSRSYWAPANIGPYSQAISIPSYRESETRHVYVAGQIPLIPASMEIPSLRSGDQDCLEAVLSLQHLWQIGREMNVDWWTGAIAFLQKDHIAAIKHKAVLAGKVWRQIHDNDDSDEDEEAERDLWEEKFHYDLQIRGGTNDYSKQFPDSTTIEGQNNYIPPCFAAEVEQLPRNSSIEWQALLGLHGGAFKPSSHFLPKLGTIHKFEVGEGKEPTHFIIAIPAEFSEVCKATIHDWYRSQDTQPNSQASYLDITAKGLWDSDLVKGIVPCRSIWDSNGNRLAAILVY